MVVPLDCVSSYIWGTEVNLDHFPLTEVGFVCSMYMLLSFKEDGDDKVICLDQHVHYCTVMIEAILVPLNQHVFRCTLYGPLSENWVSKIVFNTEYSKEKSRLEKIFTLRQLSVENLVKKVCYSTLPCINFYISNAHTVKLHKMFLKVF